MKIQNTYETETFISGCGYYGIKQVDPTQNSNPVILLSPHQMKLLIADMREHLKRTEEWWPNDRDRG